MGWMLWAFGWTYALFQIPGGWLVDRMRAALSLSRHPDPVVAGDALPGIVGSFIACFCIRLMVGLLEAPAYSIFNQVTTSWFPARERATAVGFFISAQFLGLAFITAAGVDGRVFRLALVFFITGGGGAALGHALVSSIAARANPGASTRPRWRRSKPAAPSWIWAAPPPETKFTWADFFTVFKYTKLWGIYIGQFTVTSSQFFFFTWFPTYLAEYRHLSVLKAGLYACAALPRRRFSARRCPAFSPTAAAQRLHPGHGAQDPHHHRPADLQHHRRQFRRSPECWCSSSSLAFFGNGMASIGWSLISSGAPRRLIGLTGGTFNFISNLSGIVTPIIIGYLAQNGNFAPGLIYIAFVALIGALAYILMIGKLERVASDERFAERRTKWSGGPFRAAIKTPRPDFQDGA